MYNKLITAILILFVASASLMAETADEIFEKSLKAMGADKEANMKSSIVDMTMNVMGMSIQSKVYKQGNKFRMETNQMGQSMVVVFDGNKGWMKMAGNVAEVPQDQLKGMKSQANSMTSNPLRELKDNKKTKIEKAGKTKINGATAYKIKVTDKDGKITHFFIDAKSYLLLKMTGTTEKGDLELLFQNYKTFDGIKMATKLVANIGGMQMTTEINDFQVNPKIDNSLFEKPE